MTSKAFLWAAPIIGALALATGIQAPAQLPPPVHFAGIINDFTPATDSSGDVIGPWELHGKWDMRIDRYSGKADFSAFLTMEFSDYWLEHSPSASLVNPATRMQHTHHITLSGATVSPDISSCPPDSPATQTGFMVTGMASVTGNGNPAPFQLKGGLSQLQICVTGGATQEYSNIELSFQSESPAAGHFGSQAIHGATVHNSEPSADPNHEGKDLGGHGN